MVSSTTQEPPKQQKDWSSTQYLKFANQRTRPVHDLISHIKPLLSHTATPQIHDLGCGPGNSTAALLSHFPSAHVTGLDSSPDMLAKARATLPTVTFSLGDVATFQPPAAAAADGDDGGGADLIFSNAVFHWLRRPARIPTLVRIFRALRPGGVLALQVPDNYDQAAHALMRDVATTQAGGESWTRYFADTRVGDVADPTRPDLDPIEPMGEWYDALSPYAGDVDIWRTEYAHVLSDAGAIVEWVRGTGLQPFLNRMGDDEGAKKEFLEAYEKALEGVYKGLGDGKVMLGYPRLFVVAVRK